MEVVHTIIINNKNSNLKAQKSKLQLKTQIFKNGFWTSQNDFYFQTFANKGFYATLKLLIEGFNMFSQAGIGSLIARIVTFIFVAIVVLDLIGIIPAIIIDIKRKKFHWSKWVIISAICAFILFFIINLIAGILFFNPADDSNMFPTLISPAP